MKERRSLFIRVTPLIWRLRRSPHALVQFIPYLFITRQRTLDCVWSDLVSPFLCNILNQIASILPMSAREELKGFFSQLVVWRAVTNTGCLSSLTVILLSHYLPSYVNACLSWGGSTSCSNMFFYPKELHAPLVGAVLWWRAGVRHYGSASSG